MNFVRIENNIYFHGARSGEKIEGQGKSASFSAYKSLSIIPSYWSDEKSACPAIALFQSVIVKGQFEQVDSLEVKAMALQKLMEKLQPEGKYLSFRLKFRFL
jgi:nitroimidazol reductase NimA-like FMN-containing flavoprotein (pyridoxamine 5'-phosphate oxidase superfamily)